VARRERRAARAKGIGVDLWSLLQILFRRIYIAVPALLVGAAASMSYAASIEPDYEVTGALVLLGPGTETVVSDTETVVESRNPLLRFSGSLGTTAEALELSLASQRTRASIDARGLSTDFIVNADSRSPIMQFKVTAESAEVASETMEAIMDYVESDLDERQDRLDAPADERIAVQRLSSGNEPEAGLESRRRTQLLLAAVSGLLAVMVTVAADSILARRRTPTSAQPAAPETEAGPEPTPAADPTPRPAALASMVAGAAPAARQGGGGTRSTGPDQEAVDAVRRIDEGRRVSDPPGRGRTRQAKPPQPQR